MELEPTPKTKKKRTSAKNRSKDEIVVAPQVVLDNPLLLAHAADNAPGEIYGHTSVAYKSSLYVFGGCFKDGKMSEGVFVFDLETKTWSKCLTTEGPRSRHFHSCVVYRNQMIVFGGKNNSYLNDLWQFDLELHTWSPINVFSGRPPSKRYGHSAVLWNNSMWIYGGFDDFGYKSDELFQFKFDSKMWHAIDTFKVDYSKEPNGAPLKLELYQHSAVVYNNSMYIFGGRCDKKEDFNNDLLQYTFGTRSWARVSVKGKLPSPRWGHRAIVFHERMYCFGGSDYVLDFSDIYKFNFSTETWSKATVPSTFPPKFYHSLCLMDNTVMLYAGCNRHGYLFGEIFQFTHDKIIDRTDISSEARLLLKETSSLLTTQKEFADIVFEFPKESKCLYAHKGILISRCELYATMFRSTMKEGRDNNTMLIEQDSYKVFFSFLLYLYTSVACTDMFTLDDMVELLYLANRHFVVHLKLTCEKRIQHQFLNSRTAIALFDVASRANAQVLSRKCIKTIANFYEILKHEEMPPELVQKVQQLLEKETPKGMPIF